LGVSEGDLNSQLESLASKNPDADVTDDILDWMAQSDNHLYHKVVSKVRKAEQPPVQQAPQPQAAPAPSNKHQYSKKVYVMVNIIHGLFTLMMAHQRKLMYPVMNLM
jgi:hypothetical protein